MTQRTESKWQFLRQFLEGYMKVNTSYRAGNIYEAYLNECDCIDISRKDFEMFLRNQVLKDDGMLKRISHGIYEMRTDPNDRGVLFTRGTEKPSAEKTEINLDEILDESMELTSKVKDLFEKLNRQDGIPLPAQMELHRLQSSIMKSIDVAVTGITATMSWCEDNMGINTQEETEIINMGGI